MASERTLTRRMRGVSDVVATTVPTCTGERRRTRPVPGLTAPLTLSASAEQCVDHVPSRLPPQIRCVSGSAWPA